MQIWARYTYDREKRDEVESIGLKKVKLTLSMSYVGVRFLVGPVESSGSAEEEGEGQKPPAPQSPHLAYNTPDPARGPPAPFPPRPIPHSSLAAILAPDI